MSRTYLPPYRPAFRTFSITPRRQAAEVPDEFINAIKHTALFQKLADKPDALKALSDLYALTKEMGAFSLLVRLVGSGLYYEVTRVVLTIEGLDINSTTPPSQYQMFKLVANRRFMRAVKRVMKELNEAGLKTNSDVRGSRLLLVGCPSVVTHICLPFLGCAARNYGPDTGKTSKKR